MIKLDSTCPRCGTSGVYNSGITVECPNKQCALFSQKQLDATSGKVESKSDSLTIIRMEEVGDIYLTNLSDNVVTTYTVGKRAGKSVQFTLSDFFISKDTLPFLTKYMSQYEYYNVTFTCEQASTVQVELNKKHPSLAYEKDLVEVDKDRKLILTFGDQ